MMVSQRVVLVAEDEENDFFLLKWAFAKCGENVLLIRVTDGVEAINYFEGRNEFADRRRFPLPELFLLDLKMPRKDGFDVLDWLSRNPAFRSIVVIVLSSSKQDQDVSRAYELGANSFLAKPNDSVGLASMTKSIVDFWFRWSHCPRSNGG
jgi:CheY-like chemotaxis protein